MGDDDPVLAREPGDLSDRYLEVLELLLGGAFLTLRIRALPPSATIKIGFGLGVFMAVLRLPHVSLSIER